MKLGYLGPQERENLAAIRQAVTLLFSDQLGKRPKPSRPKKATSATPEMGSAFIVLSLTVWCR